MDQGSAGPGVAQNDQLGTLIRSENIARLILNLRRDAGLARTWDGSSAVLAVPGLGPATGRAGFLGVPASARGRTGQQALKRWGDRGHLAGASLQRQPRLDAKLLVMGSVVVPDWDPTAPRRGRAGHPTTQWPRPTVGVMARNPAGPCNVLVNWLNNLAARTEGEYLTNPVVVGYNSLVTARLLLGDVFATFAVTPR